VQQAALTGIRVVEVGSFIAAPFATMQLADLGADVVKVENPDGGDQLRSVGPFPDGSVSAPFLQLNRNKRSLAVDLRQTEGKAVLARLLERSDILIENLRPSTLARLGFDYQSASQINPRLIYASASGWGQDGPLARAPGLDIMAQARAGLMSITGNVGGDPVKLGVPMCDLVCGLYIALATLAALTARHDTGSGQFIDVSLFEAGVAFTVWEAARYFTNGEIAQAQGSAHQSAAPYQAFRTSDGWITIGAPTPTTWASLCDALGLPDLSSQKRYVTSFERYRHRDTLVPAIEAVTRRKTTQDLLALLEKAEVPCAPIANMRDVYTDEHLSARGFFWSAQHARLGPVNQLGSPMRLSLTPTKRGNAAPQLGADSTQVLAELGFLANDIDRLLADGVVVCPSD
jgi:crotonobetainyl-CoA:carnitine CoA-transferase CaiB-like acyl-CoA transferase